MLYLGSPAIISVISNQLSVIRPRFTDHCSLTTVY